MDHIEIGKFIAACRKEKGMTQAQLAEKMGVSDRAVSKWETGKNMPDCAIMLDLCSELGISVNDLFNGRRIAMENYKEIAEKTMLEMHIQEEQANKRLLAAEKFMTIIIVIVTMIMIAAGISVAENYPAIGIALCLLGSALVFVFAFYAVKLEYQAGYYECQNCGERYIPSSYWKVCFALHVGDSRKLTCPHCGKRNYHKKVLTKEK